MILLDSFSILRRQQWIEAQQRQIHWGAPLLVASQRWWGWRQLSIRTEASLLFGFM